MLWALALLILAPDDPRPHLIELQLEGRRQEALQGVVEIADAQPELSDELGLSYLRGHLLESLGRSQEAHQAFAEAMSSSPLLAGYSRYRLARNQYLQGHPEVAAGLIATLLAGQAPRPLVPVATRLLADSVRAGGDCRLLGGIDSWPLQRRQLRQLQIVLADCAAQRGNVDGARQVLISLLRDDLSDDPARRAAERLVQIQGPPASLEAETTRLLGLTFHHHRLFDQAINYLDRWLSAEGQPSGPLSERYVDVSYALARSYFWQAEYATAAVLFEELSAAAVRSKESARSLYQQGRSLELHGDWTGASRSHRLAYQADPQGEWAAAALTSALRVEWRGGRENAAKELLAILRTRRGWRSALERMTLFIASSDIVRGQSDRAGAWLDQAERAEGGPTLEASFWRGRLAELEGKPTTAVRHYATVLAKSPYHPLGQRATVRLASEGLATAARTEGQRLTGSSRTSDLLRSFLLLEAGSRQQVATRKELLRRLSSDPRASPFLDLETVKPGEWLIWNAKIRQPEDLLLSLGIIEQGSGTAQKYFPLQPESLGFTGSQILARANLHKPSLYMAEILEKRVPETLPALLLPRSYRELLYPLPYRDLIESEAGRFGTDPDLVAAIIREESRFDPQALSGASARGLTQFVLPTALRLVGEIGADRLIASDLHRPEISIALGSAYLAELEKRFRGREHAMVAAYNAGENQAQLWQSYCYSFEPEEYYTKVGFRQTRAYLERVFSSRAQYAEIYGPEPSAAEDSDTTGGSSPSASSK